MTVKGFLGCFQVVLDTIEGVGIGDILAISGLWGPFGGPKMGQGLRKRNEIGPTNNL